MPIQLFGRSTAQSPYYLVIPPIEEGSLTANIVVFTTSRLTPKHITRPQSPFRPVHFQTLPTNEMTCDDSTTLLRGSCTIFPKTTCAVLGVERDVRCDLNRRQVTSQFRLVVFVKAFETSLDAKREILHLKIFGAINRPTTRMGIGRVLLVYSRFMAH